MSNFRSCFRKKWLLAAVVCVLIVGLSTEVCHSQAYAETKQRIVNQVARKWIDVGKEQYARGLYRAAEESFLRAMAYEEYLPESDREKLVKLLDKAHTAASERNRVLELLEAVDVLIEECDLVKAKLRLEEIRDNEFLSENEMKLVEGGLSRVKVKLAEQRKTMAALYNQSVDYYEAGELEKARKGFLEVARNETLVAPEGLTAADAL